MCQMESKSKTSLSETHVRHVSPLDMMKIQNYGLGDKGNPREPMGE